MKRILLFIIFVMTLSISTCFAETVRGYVIDYSYSPNYTRDYDDDAPVYVNFVIKDINGNRTRAYIGGKRIRVEKGIKMVYRSCHYGTPFDFKGIDKGSYLEIHGIDIIPKDDEDRFVEAHYNHEISENEKDIKLRNIVNSLVPTGKYKIIKAKIEKYQVTDNYFRSNPVKDVIISLDAHVYDADYESCDAEPIEDEYGNTYDPCAKREWIVKEDYHMPCLIWGKKSVVGSFIQEAIDYKFSSKEVTISGKVYQSTFTNKKYIVVDDIN